MTGAVDRAAQLPEASSGLVFASDNVAPGAPPCNRGGGSADERLEDEPRFDAVRRVSRRKTVRFGSSGLISWRSLTQPASTGSSPEASCRRNSLGGGLARRGASAHRGSARPADLARCLGRERGSSPVCEFALVLRALHVVAG